MKSAAVTIPQSSNFAPSASPNTMIALVETADSYLMKVDLPSCPVALGEIVAKRTELTVESDAQAAPGSAQHALANFLSIKTLGGRLNAIYQEGALYILLPKTA